MDPMTDAELDELAALADQSTPGPWIAYYDNVESIDDGGQRHMAEAWVVDRMGFPEPHLSTTLCDVASGSQDAYFIAAARLAVPQLVEEVRRLRGLAPGSATAT